MSPVKVPVADKQSLGSRQKILASVLLLCGLVGLPLWHLTTSVHRAELPASKIYEMDSQLSSLVWYEIPVYVDIPPPVTSMIAESQSLIDNTLKQHSPPLAVDWRIVLRSGKGSPEDYKIQLIYSPDDEIETETVSVSPFDDRTTKISLSKHVIQKNKVPEFIARVATDFVFRSEIEMFSNFDEPESVIKMPYSPNYHVSLSLLQGGLTPIGWDIEGPSKLFRNYLQHLTPFAKFTLDTQVEHYEKLSSNINLNYSETTQAYYLRESDTSTFIDYSEWGIDQNTDLVPAINFLAYVPAPENRPILIENSVSNSFIVPQWGGVAIVNTEKTYLEADDLISVMEIFASQLFQLIGAPREPKSPTIRTDILTRFQSLKNMRKSLDNLISLVKLCDQLPTISIPDSTLVQVESALAQIELSVAAVNSGHWALANSLAAEAFVLSNKAFFQKDMVQQMYFPDEHKMAVYTPLLGPIGTIIFLGSIRLLKETKLAKKAHSKEE